MWTDNELAWKWDYEGMDYILSQVNHDNVENPKISLLLKQIAPLYKELNDMLSEIYDNLEEEY